LWFKFSILFNGQTHSAAQYVLYVGAVFGMFASTMRQSYTSQPETPSRILMTKRAVMFVTAFEGCRFTTPVTFVHHEFVAVNRTISKMAVGTKRVRRRRRIHFVFFDTWSSRFRIQTFAVRTSEQQVIRIQGKLFHFIDELAKIGIEPSASYPESTYRTLTPSQQDHPRFRKLSRLLFQAPPMYVVFAFQPYRVLFDFLVRS
jgi:hypothetical protein